MVSYDNSISSLVIIVEILLHVVKCPRPASDNPVIIEGYRSPAIEGTTITLRCSTGLILTGSTTATCKGNGEWEPNLKGTMCKGELIDKNKKANQYYRLQWTAKSPWWVVMSVWHTIPHWKVLCWHSNVKMDFILMMNSLPGAIVIEHGYLILLVMCVLHHHKVY